MTDVHLQPRTHKGLPCGARYTTGSLVATDSAEVTCPGCRASLPPDGIFQVMAKGERHQGSLVSCAIWLEAVVESVEVATGPWCVYAGPARNGSAEAWAVALETALLRAALSGPQARLLAYHRMMAQRSKRRVPLWCRQGETSPAQSLSRKGLLEKQGSRYCLTAAGQCFLTGVAPSSDEHAQEVLASL